MEKSTLRPMALKVAGWGLLHGDFFDLHAISGLLDAPDAQAGYVLGYLRTLSFVDTVAETRSCKRELGKRSSRRVFIKVLAIHPEPSPRTVKEPPEPKWEPVQWQLTRLVKIMPSPRGAR